MKPIWRVWRESLNIFPWLVLIAVILGIIDLFKEKVISIQQLHSNKDAIQSLASIISTLIIILGALFSYFRFFKGRTFSPKLIIKLNVRVIKFENIFLHSLETELQNTGSVAIWNYHIRINATHHTDTPYSMEVKDYISLPKDLKSEEVIDVGESSFELAYLYVPNNVIAVTYQVIIFDQVRNIWTRSITVKNSETS